MHELCPVWCAINKEEQKSKGIRYACFAFDANLTSCRKAISRSFSCSVKNIKNDEAYWLKVFDIKPQNKMNRNDYHQWLAEIDYPVK